MTAIILAFAMLTPGALRAQWITGQQVEAVVTYDVNAQLVRITEAPLFANSFE
jgi:hypothetical protein